METITPLVDSFSRVSLAPPPAPAPAHAPASTSANEGEVGSAAQATAVTGHSPNTKEAATPYTHSTIPLAWHQPKVTYAAGCSPDTVPGPRAAHSCNIIGNRIYVFGGWNGKAGLQHLCVLDTDTMEWSQPETRGTPPSSRNNHATFVYDNRLYVHGGHDGSKWLSDLHVFDPGSQTWSQCEVSGAVPSPRACHTITIARNKAWLFGEDLVTEAVFK